MYLCNPQVGTADTTKGLSIHSSTPQRKPHDWQESLQSAPPTPWDQIRAQVAEAREGPGLVGGSTRWLRRAAGAALQGLRQAGRAPFSVRLTAARVCTRGNGNQRKVGWSE